VNLTDWTFVSSFGFDSSIYAKGNHRVLVSKDRGEIARYEMSKSRKNLDPRCKECKADCVCSNDT